MQDSESGPTEEIVRGDRFYSLAVCESLRDDDVSGDDWSPMRVTVGRTLGDAWEDMKTIGGMFGDVAEYRENLADAEDFIYFRKEGEEDPIPDWREFKPGPEDEIVLGILPGGGQKGGAIKVIAIASLIFAASYISWLPAWVSVGLKHFAVNYALSNLAEIFGSQPDRTRHPNQPYISGGRNRMAPGEMVPILLGIRRYAPPLAAPDYEEYVNGEQYWNFLYSMGSGPLKAEDMRLGTQPLSNFKDVEIDHDWTGQGTLLEFDNVDPERFNARVGTDWTVKTTAAGTDKMQLGFAYPQGLYGTDNKGRTTNAAVHFVVQYRLKTENNSREWITAYDARRETAYKARMLQGVTIDLGIVGYTEIPAVTRRVRKCRTERYNPSGNPGDSEFREVCEWVDEVITPAKFVPKRGRLTERGVYEVRVRRTWPENINNARYTDRLDWTSMMSYQEEQVVNNAQMPLTRLRIRATNDLNGNIGHFNCVAGALMPVYDQKSKTWRGTNSKYQDWVGGSKIASGAVDFDSVGKGQGTFSSATGGPVGATQGAWAYAADGPDMEYQLATWEARGELFQAFRIRTRLNNLNPWGEWGEWASEDNPYQFRNPDAMFETDGPRIIIMNAFGMPPETLQASGLTKEAYAIVANVPNGQEVFLFIDEPRKWQRAFNRAVTDQRDWSENPADIIRYCLTDPQANPKPFPIEKIDESALGEFWEHCSERQLTYSKHVTSRRELMQVWEEVANAGFGSMEFANGKWKVVFDSKKPFPTTMFTSSNTENFQGRVNMEAVPDAFRVRFPNKDKDYRWDERLVPGDGFTESTAKVVRRVSWDFVCDPASIWHLARHQMRSSKYRRTAWEFTAPMDYSYLERQEAISFAHFGALIGQASGYVRSVDPARRQVELDVNVTIGAGDNWKLQVLKNDGSGYVTKDVTGRGTSNVINVSDTDDIAVGALWEFGVAPTQKCVILGIKPEGKRMGLHVVPAADNIHDDDPAPNFVSVLEPEVTPEYLGPPKAVIESIVSNEDALPTTLGADKSPAILMTLGVETPEKPLSTLTTGRFFHVRWKPNTDDEIEWDGRNQSVEDARFTIQPVQAETEYRIGVTVIDADSNRSEEVWINHTAEGLSARPPDVTNFRPTQNGNQTFVHWDFPVPGPADMAGFVLKFTPQKNATKYEVFEQYGNIHPPLARSAPVQTQAGTYAIKAVDTSGNESENAAFATIQSGITRTDSLEVFRKVEAPTWAGTKSNVEIINNQLALQRYKRPASAPKMSEWTSLAWFRENGLHLVNPERDAFRTSGHYTTTPAILSNGSFLTSCEAFVTISTFLELSQIIRRWGILRTVGRLRGNVPENVYTVTPQARVGDTLAEMNAAPFQTLLTDDLAGRYFQFRILIETDEDNISPTINVGTFVGSLGLRSEQGTITTPADVTFSSKFYQSPVVFAQGAQGRERVDNITRTGARIRAVDASDNFVSGRNLLWQASGYGAQIE